ncbi:MAG: HD domain-containing protein [Spirochaetaceae bacterium]|nr:MAG: HD domain-containing protein [Spirochaetaceae bacterium]
MEPQKIYTELNRMLEEPRLRKLYRAAEAAFNEKDPIAHNWEHVRRDILHAVWIGLEEGADMGIVLPAMILHDLGYVTHSHDPRQHPLHGSRECYRFLGDWTLEEQEKISDCILKHKGKYPGFEHAEPRTLEEKVVCDADQVDKFGWVGFMQMMKVYVEYGYLMGIERYKTLAGLAEAMTHIEGVTLYTETGIRLAAERSDPDFLEISSKLSNGLSLYDDWKEPF